MWDPLCRAWVGCHLSYFCRAFLHGTKVRCPGLVGARAIPLARRLVGACPALSQNWLCTEAPPHTAHRTDKTDTHPAKAITTTSKMGCCGSKNEEDEENHYANTAEAKESRKSKRNRKSAHLAEEQVSVPMESTGLRGPSEDSRPVSCVIINTVVYLPCISAMSPFTEGCAGAYEKASPPGRQQRCTFRPTTVSSVQFKNHYIQSSVQDMFIRILGHYMINI